MKVLNQGDFARRAIELEMDADEWNLWRVKNFDIVAKVAATFGTSYYLLVVGNPVIVHVRTNLRGNSSTEFQPSKDRNQHVYRDPVPEKEEEMLA